jgi:glycosyltransferase involved in cell wall biosynthesis/2-polyprenyl-3-methyl-5-hydroxy-6-metoxy-1,4-benzoquinol methylase
MNYKKAPISMCLIVKNNENCLEQCLLSFKDYVDQIVIIDTGSTDNTPQIALKYANMYEVYTDCNDPETGLIADFSMARNRAFELATNEIVGWIDSDDILVGAENLPKVVSELMSSGKSTIIMFPYEYSYNEAGKCTCLHYRERLFSNKNDIKFINPVHEVAVPYDGINPNFIINEDVVFKHQRQFLGTVIETGRNLRILKDYFDKVGESDARQMYYLGLEYSNNGFIKEALEYLSRYVEISGWDDERAMACLKLVELYQNLGQYEAGLKWAFKTIELKESWGEGYFSLAKMFYFLAQAGGPYEMRNWERCVHFSKLGLQLPPTKTLLFVNPLERDYEIHRYLNFALSKLGDFPGALESVNIALATKPNDQVLLSNKKLYLSWMLKQNIIQNLNQLKEIDGINDDHFTTFNSLINGQTPQLLKQNEAVNYDRSPFPVANTSSNNDYWSIPIGINFDSYPINLNQAQLQSVVLLIWKQYMLHDEVLSAISFLEKAPYSVRHSFETEKALKLTKACLDWMKNDADFQSTNSPANTEVEAGNPLPNKLVMSEGHRFDFVAERLKPESIIVDFGCMDGCFTNRFGMLGHKPTGLDVCESSIKLARKKAIEFNTGAKYVQSYFHEAVDKVPNNYFEYATSTDTYEHLVDPVTEMLIPAKKMLKEDGKFLLATPYGSWMRGQYVDWAHPWLFEKEGKSWLSPFARGHIVAPTVWTVAEDFRKAGYWVKDCYPDLCDNSMDERSREIKDQGNIFAEAHLKFPEGYNKGLDVIFMIGDGVENYTPKTVKKTGIGGSELMAIEMSKRLAGLGHRVRLYNSCGESGEGIYDGVEYRSTNKFQDLKCDVLVVSRRADYLAEKFNIEAKIKLLWTHDVTPICYTNELLLKADRILCLSNWHKQFVMEQCNVNSEHIIVTRNGVDLSRFENKNIQRDRYKCICTSSPDRYLYSLLQMWPKIKECVPKANLILGYGWYNWEQMAKSNKGHMDLINLLKNTIKEMEPLGVTFKGRMNQEELSNELLSSSLWLFPSHFTETYCVSAAEMTAAGVKMITSDLAALKETVGARGTLIPGDWLSEHFQKKFIEMTIKLLSED